MSNLSAKLEVSSTIISNGKVDDNRFARLNRLSSPLIFDSVQSVVRYRLSGNIDPQLSLRAIFNRFLDPLLSFSVS